MIRWAAGRPAVVWSLAAGLIVAGAVAFTRLPLATKTRVDTPRISVNASWRGSAPEVMETYLTSPIEAAIQSSAATKAPGDAHECLRSRLSDVGPQR